MQEDDVLIDRNASASPFDDKESLPEGASLKKALGMAYSAYREILRLTDGFSQEWKYYSKKYGWQLKVGKKGKALFYLTPGEKCLRLGFAVRETEKDALLNSKLPAKVKEELKSAKRYPEGYPLRLAIGGDSDKKAALLVIQLLKSMRSSD